MIKRTKTVTYADSVPDPGDTEQTMDHSSQENVSPTTGAPPRRGYSYPTDRIPQDRRMSPDLRLATEGIRHAATDPIPTYGRDSMNDVDDYKYRLSMLERSMLRDPLRDSWGDRYVPNGLGLSNDRNISSEERARNVQIYRDLVGITSPPGVADLGARAAVKSYLCFRRPAKNRGYYQSILDEEFKATIWYHTSTWVSNALLALQIAIAATLTALGVSTGKNRGTAITVLGAINTAVATTLAYLKAKGLPMRALTYRNDLRRLREHIEYMERQFELGINPRGLDPAKVVAGYRDTFDRVQKVQQKQETDAQIGALSAHPAGKVGTPVEIKTPKKTPTEVNGAAVPSNPVKTDEKPQDASQMV